MKTRYIISAILFFIVAEYRSPPSSTAQARRDSPDLHAAVVSHGVEIGLSLKQGVFPRKALIRATLRLRNRTAHPLMFGAWPEVQVLNRAGHVVYRAGYDSYPDVVHLRAGPSGPIGPEGEVPSPLRPGQSSVRQIFLLLRGAWLRPVVELFTPQYPHAAIGSTTTIYGPTIRVRLTRGRPPHIVVSRTGLEGYEMHALVTPATPAQRGTFWYMAVERCGNTINGTLDWSPVFTFAPGVPQLMTSCLGRPTEWHIAVAWLNQPLARYDFVSSPRRINAACLVEKTERARKSAGGPGQQTRCLDSAG